MTHCPRCNQDLPDDQFYRRDGAGYYCKPCSLAYSNQRNAAIRAGTWTATTKRHVKEPTTIPGPESIAWAAGFIEGEGSFVDGKTSCRVIASQKEPECLHRLQQYFGGSVMPATRKSGFGDFHVWNWVVCGPKARAVMAAVYEQMSSRRQAKIREILATDAKRNARAKRIA